jgi:hypothetical protein
MNQLAARIVRDSTQSPPMGTPSATSQSSPAKNPAAVALGRLGGLKGGIERAKKLTPDQRRDIALRGAQARWAKKAA